jgi:hypothetical protein
VTGRFLSPSVSGGSGSPTAGNQAIPADNLPFSFRLIGRLKVPALVWAFGEIVRRHESLRTRFLEAGGGS